MCLSVCLSVCLPVCSRIDRRGKGWKDQRGGKCGLPPPFLTVIISCCLRVSRVIVCPYQQWLVILSIEHDELGKDVIVYLYLLFVHLPISAKTSDI